MGRETSRATPYLKDYTNVIKITVFVLESGYNNSKFDKLLQ